MDLFIMRRYGGENEIDDNSRYENHLSSLLSKIEKRRLIKEQLQSIENSAVDSEPTSVERVKINSDVENNNKRKFILEEDIQGPRSTVDPNANAEINIEKESKPIKKREKLEELCEDLQLNVSEIDNVVSDAVKEKGEITGFTVIGVDKFKKKSKVKRVLPFWLAKPHIISGSMKELRITVHDIPDLDKDLIRKLQENDIEYFFPVQCEVIPWLLKVHKRPLQYRPNDVCVSAPTGSGKTLAFVLPIIQALKSRVMRHIRALVVLPVQDLAVQIYQVFSDFCKGTDLKVLLLTGQKSFSSEQQELVKTSVIIGQYNAVDIIVTTPGRLVDHLNCTPGFSLQYLRFLVIDEADRVVNNVQDNWLYHVEKHIYGETFGKQVCVTSSSLHSAVIPPLQKLLFSATLTQDPQKLEELKLFEPKLFTTVFKDHIDNEKVENEVRGEFIGKYTTPAELTEEYCVVDAAYKPLALYQLIMKGNWNHVLCFTSSQENTHRLTLLLKYLFKGTLEIGEISAALKFGHRSRVLKEFSSGRLNILVSSDALARGMDIPSVEYVVSYDTPKFVKTYIHRVGRTGRAGKLGTAVTLLTNEEVNKFKEMLHSVGKGESVHEISTDDALMERMEDEYQKALDALRDNLEKMKAQETIKNKLIKQFTHKNNRSFKKKRRQEKV